MSLVEGTVTATADSLGNVTLGGSDFALAIAQALDPGIAPAQILAYKAALGNPTAFADLVTKLYASTATKIASLTAYLNANISGGGSFTAGGDLSGSSSSQNVIRWLGELLDPFTMGLPTDGQIPVYVSGSTAWRALNVTGDVTFSNTGVVVVTKIKGTTISTAGGSLATGAVLRATGGAVADWGAVDLANASAVTGVLPTAKQAAQAIGGDGSGTTAALVVVAWRGKSLDASTMGAPADAQIPIWVNGSSAWKSLSVSGDATIANNGAMTVAKVNGTSVPATPAVSSLLQATSTTSAVWVDPTSGIAAIPFANMQSHHLVWYNGEDTTGSFETSSGWKLPAVSGTVAVVAPSSGSKLNGTRRCKFTVTTATSQLGFYESFNGTGGFYAWRGDAAGRGGFKYVERFAVVSSGNSSTWQHHHGLGNFAGSPGFTDYTTDHSVSRVMLVQAYTATAGGAVPAATNWKISECNATTNTLTDTGIAIVHGNLVELILYCAPNGTITWTVNDITAGTTASGSCTTSPPATTTFMCPGAHSSISVAGTGTCQIDISIIYLEMFD